MHSNLGVLSRFFSSSAIDGRKGGLKVWGALSYESRPPAVPRRNSTNARLPRKEAQTLLASYQRRHGKAEDSAERSFGNRARPSMPKLMATGRTQRRADLYRATANGRRRASEGKIASAEAQALAEVRHGQQT